MGGVQKGIASWYGPGFHGNHTANGEIYNQYDLTAAHPSLPLGTHAMVTNLTNGRSVEVRVNDRGPFVGGRAIDLSYAAARVIGMVGPGTAPVRVEVLATHRHVAAQPPAPAVRRDESGKRYAIEVASFSARHKAEHLRNRLTPRFPETHVSAVDIGERTYYRVRLGPYPARETAVAHAEQVVRLGYPAVITKEAVW